MVRRSDEIGERVPLVQKFSVFIPATSHVSRAANVGNGADETAVQQTDAVGRKRGLRDDAVRAVAVKIQGIRAVAADSAPVDEGDGDALAVGRRGEHAFT